jgi:hypothetical protein
MYVKAEKYPVFTTTAIIATFGVAIWLFAIPLLKLVNCWGRERGKGNENSA